MQNTNTNLDLAQITICAIIGLAIISTVTLFIIIVAKRIYKPYTKRLKANLKNKKFRNKIFIILLALIIILISYDIFSPIGGKNIRYFAKWVECGQRPVMLKYEYKTPAYYGYGNENNIMSSSQPKFCSPKEAELNGYTSGPHSSTYKYTTREERIIYQKEHGRIE